MYLLDQAPPLSAYNPVIHNYFRTILDMCTFRHFFTQINALVTVRACVPGSTIYDQYHKTHTPKGTADGSKSNFDFLSIKSSWVPITPAVIERTATAEQALKHLR